MQQQNWRRNPYVEAIVRHIYKISQNHAPGFTTSKNDNVAPITELQQVFTDVYMLDEYAPIIWHMDYLHNQSNEKPMVYYSLTKPILRHFSPSSRSLTNNLEDIREILHILENTQQHPLLQGYLDNISYTGIHHKRDAYKRASISTSLLETDSSLRQALDKYPKHRFASSG